MQASHERVVLETERLAVVRLGLGGEARLQAVFDRAPDHFLALNGRPPAPDAAVAELRAAVAEPGRAMAVLSRLDGGGDVGVLGWWTQRPEPHLALLGTILVVPEARGQGLAREALEGLEIWLAGQGMQALRTAFPRRRLSVHPIVRALGFQEMSILEHTKLGMAGVGTSLWVKALPQRSAP